MSGTTAAGRLSIAIGTLVLTAPLTAVVTMLLMPLWQAVEARWGIESVGHAGVAPWCFSATYAALALPALVRTQRRFDR